jgi:hypothetical protein
MSSDDVVVVVAETMLANTGGDSDSNDDVSEGVVKTLQEDMACVVLAS